MTTREVLVKYLRIECISLENVDDDNETDCNFYTYKIGLTAEISSVDLKRLQEDYPRIKDISFRIRITNLDLSYLMTISIKK